MINKFFVYLNRRMWARLLIPVSLGVIMVMGATLWYGISFQYRLGTEQMTHQNRILIQAVTGGIGDALVAGDTDRVRNQLRGLHEKTREIEILVCDPQGIISFATDPVVLGKPAQTYMGEPAGRDLTAILESGKPSFASFYHIRDQEAYVLESAPILDKENSVLGGIVLFSSLSPINQTILKGRNTSIIIGVSGGCAIIVMVWMFFNFLVNKKVKRIITATSRLREKDFTHEYQVTQGDELNHILARIGLVTQEFRQTLQQIVTNSSTIFSSAAQLSQIADSLNASSQDASDMTVSVAAAAEEMTQGNLSMAAAMEDATQTLSLFAAAVEQMSTTIGEIARNSAGSRALILQVVQAFETILPAVEELGTRADDVDQVTDEIRAISEQVSMLALNAKIEAARAGDAGKGFAVVAQEITDLAFSTSKSTLEADEKLRWIKATAKQLSEKVSSLSGIVKESDDAITLIATAVEEQRITTREIASNINGVSDKISQVSLSVSQGAQVAADIAQDITRVQEVSGQVQINSGTLNENASALKQMAEKFTALMKQFKV